MDQVKSLNGLDIGKCFLVKSVQLGIHGSAAFIVFCHSAQERTGKECTERHAKECKQGKGRVIIQYDCQCTDKTEAIDDQVRNPVQNTAGYIGCIRAPPGNQITGMVICQRFPVRHQHFRKNFIFNLCIHLQADKSGSISGSLGNQNVGNGKTDHGGKGAKKLPGLVTGNDIHQIFGDQAGDQRDTGAHESKQGIQDHSFPVAAAILIDPQCLSPHFLQSALFQVFLNQQKFLFHDRSSRRSMASLAV